MYPMKSIIHCLTVRKLANIRCLSQIMTYTKTELAQITKLDMSSVEEVVKESAVIILKGKIYTGKEIPKVQRISTGCLGIDAVTKGGIAVNGITEIAGCSGVGKTQMCLQLALTTQLPLSLGGLEKSVVYICTEDVFPAKRLNQLAQEFTYKYRDFIQVSFEDNIFIDHVADVGQLKRSLFTRLPKLLTVKNIGLVVIDSIAGVFRSENFQVNYSDRSQDFIWIAATLGKLSRKHGFAIVCVNQVTDNPATGRTEPCLGLAWSNIVTYRFNICRYFKNQMRKFEIVFAPDVPDITCEFQITTGGLSGIDH